jgi:NAD(P)H-hydrate repair Nnr-like enzyme with NAD(P)H-hydrate epimerase domain
MTRTPASALTLLYSSREIRAVEQHYLAPPHSAPLMERAGLATAEAARELLGDQGTDILVLAGPGNNGGDAFVAARHLKQWWYRVNVVFHGDAFKLSPDAAQALQAWRDCEARHASGPRSSINRLAQILVSELSNRAGFWLTPR